MPTIYPLLKPHDWPHKGIVAHRLITDKVPGVPIVAFGFDAGGNYQFVPREEGLDLDHLNAEAMANLAALRYPWEVGDSHGLNFAASSGNEFSAERVLDPAAMLECHELLKAERIVVSAPRRTCLCAAPDGLPAEEMDLFVRLVLHTYNDDSYGHAPISPAMFVLERGVMKHVLFPTAPAPAAAKAKNWWKFWK